MNGSVTIIGIGPGDAAWRTPRADAAIAAASDVIGYHPYLQSLALTPLQRAHGSDNREELARARHALGLAVAGKNVAVISGGDGGVFGMASAVFEALETGPPAWRAIEIEVVAGISAMFAAAARVGAPLGHDFCAISLSDNLKPWDVITRRLRMVAQAGLVIAHYNPASRARPWQLGAALGLLREILPPTTPVIFATAVTRADERITVTDLAQADAAQADMRTLVLIGSEATRTIARAGKPPIIYTPRRATVPA